MKPTIIGGSLFWKSGSGRTLTTAAALSQLDSELASARIERDALATQVSALDAQYRAGVVSGKRPDREELTLAEARLEVALAKCRQIEAELFQVRKADAEHKARSITAAANTRLHEASEKFAYVGN